MKLALVLVHFHTSDLARQAVGALRENLVGLSVEAEILVVDNGSTEDERECLRRLGVRLVEPGRNLGFSGGVNLGAATASDAEALMFMNPDVMVLPGCLAALMDRIVAGAQIVGPRFFWDEACRLMLPPTERVGRWDEMLRALALGSQRAARRARRRWRTHARRHWEAEGPLRSYALSGGLLGVTRAAWQRIGPFDEAYPLYFEETDWLMRAEQQGIEASYVPAARALHLHGESARQEPKAAEWFEAGAQRFRRLHYGAWFSRLLSLAARRARPAPMPAPVAAPALVLDLRGADCNRDWWVEISPRRVGFPAAAEHLRAPLPEVWTMPADVASRLDGAEISLRAVDGSGVERPAVMARWEG